MPVRRMKDLRRSNKGGMPFALLAVALLLVSSTFCIVYANLENAEENTENITEELVSMDTVISNTESFIREGLGKVIYDISTDSSGGTLIDRTKRFADMEKDWFSSAFPRNDNGVIIEIVDEDIDIDVQTARVSANSIVAERSVASYLRATGTVEATFTGSTGMTTRTIRVVADGTSGLPFIVDCATRFELSSEGDASLLSQLVSYQLSSLAQYRIVNGYGLRSVSGGNGTLNIITGADVENAFRNALTAVETLCFRSNSENDDGLIERNRQDLAESIILNDGCYEIDIGAIISQSLLSIIDTLVIRWMDYLCIDKISEVIDKIVDFAKEVVNNVVSFLTNNHEDNKNSARVYIKNAMESCGYDEDQYRYALGGRTNIHMDPFTIGIDYNGEHRDLVISKTIDFECKCPEVDVLDWGGWENYVVDYERNRNGISDYIRNTIQGICSGMASDYGRIRVQADEFDDVSFLESFTSAVEGCLQRGLDRFGYDMESSLREDNVTDMLLASIYQTMLKERKSIFREDSVREEMIDIATNYVTIMLCGLGSLMRDEIRQGVRAIMSENASVNSVLNGYSDRVNEFYRNYERVMNSPKNQGNSIMKELVINSGKIVLKQDFVKDSVTRTAMRMMEEIEEHIRMNNGYGVLVSDGDDRFTLNDWYGDIYEEFTSIADSYNLDIDIIDPTKNPKNQHSISMKDVKMASYVSVFTVMIKGGIDYCARSMTGVDRSLNRYDSEFRDRLDIDMCFDIPCVSAWSLRGASYSSSTNLFNDVWNLLLDSIEPLLEPLKDIYEQMKRIFLICSEAVMEVNSYATELVNRLYSVIMGPLDMLTEFAEDWILERLCEAVEGLCGIIEGFDIGASNQKIFFTFCGLRLTVELRAATLLKTTKNIVKLTLEGNIGDTKFSAFIDLKKNSKNGLMFRGGGGIENDDCALNLTIDPHMKFGSKLVKIDGTIREVDIDACLPYKVLYDEFNMALSNIPGVKQAISNIALPIPGLKCAFDMGIDLKYNMPFGTGLMINEFESNPKGSDDGTEWVELYNATGSTIDLSGYMLVPESNESKAMVITGTSISPFEKKVITFERQSLNNSKSGKHNGESISLYSPSGEKIDSTPWKKDTYNDDRTWQRKADGSSTWVFIKGTPESSNGSIIKTNAIVKEFLIDCALKAADTAFEEMGNHLRSVDDVTEFLHRMLQLFIKNVIDTIAEILVSASVYITLELTDYSESMHIGLKVAFEMNSDLVREGIYWLLKQLNILQDVVREPRCNDLNDLICENTYITTTLYETISTPKVLSTLECEEMDIGYKAGVNVTGIMNMIWGENDRWKAVLGVVAEDIDASKLPKGLRSDKEKKCDLWLIKVELSKSDSPKTG